MNDGTKIAVSQHAVDRYRQRIAVGVHMSHDAVKQIIERDVRLSSRPGNRMLRFLKVMSPLRREAFFLELDQQIYVVRPDDHEIQGLVVVTCWLQPPIEWDVVKRVLLMPQRIGTKIARQLVGLDSG